MILEENKLKIFYTLLVFILDYIFLSQVFTYDKSLANMSIIVLCTYMVISAIIWGFNKLLKKKVLWVFVLHNVVFTASAFSLLLHAFVEKRGMTAIIICSIIFLFQSGAFFFYYTKILPKENFK
jgi:hypothetical protein